MHHGVHRASVVHIAARWYTRPLYTIAMVHKGASVTPPTHTHTQSWMKQWINFQRIPWLELYANLSIFAPFAQPVWIRFYMSWHIMTNNMVCHEISPYTMKCHHVKTETFFNKAKEKTNIFFLTDREWCRGADVVSTGGLKYWVRYPCQ